MEKRNSILNSKKGAMGLNAGTGLSIALAAVFILGIGLTITQDIVTDANLTGITATVVGYSPLIIGAAFLFMIAQGTGMIKRN